MWLIFTALCAVVLVWLCNDWVERTTRQHLFSDLDRLPENKVGLALGTSQKLAMGAKTMLREYLARVKTMLDLYLLAKEPKFYGDRMELP